MDLLAHAVYGATFCSRTGLAGGRTGTGGRHHWATDWTVWAGVLFGLLPDVVSLGPPWVAYLLNGRTGSYWHSIGEADLLRYHLMHSLVVAGFVLLIIRRLRPTLFLPALAWPLHILADMFTHGAGRFQTRVFYPISDWGIDSVRWWEHRELIMGYWVLLPVIWLAVWCWRHHPRTNRAPSPGPGTPNHG